MKKCIKLLFEVKDAQNILNSFILNQAQACHVEGVGQRIKDGMVQLYVCAQEEQVDDFIDRLYLGTQDVQLYNIKIETSPSDRSYRGVFRIVE